LKRRIEALILLAKRIYFLTDWLSSLRSVVSFLINWSAAELTNSSERGQAFVTEEQGNELTNSNERESAFVTKKERQETLRSLAISRSPIKKQAHAKKKVLQQISD
jgi:hypothetical protein